VGSQRLRQHRKVPTVSTDCQLCRRRRCVPWSVRYQGAVSLFISRQILIDIIIITSSTVMSVTVARGPVVAAADGGHR